MKKHILVINEPPKEIPSEQVTDGAITGNGDVTAVLGGCADRVHVYISKSDFWKADGRFYKDERGGLMPMGIVEFLLPHLAYANYKVEQNLDECYILLTLTEKNFSVKLKITVCAEDNVILFELDKDYPMLSASVSFIPIQGTEDVIECGEVKDVSYLIRGFDTPECRYPTYGICALRQISREVSEGREHVIWAMNVLTNHDRADYKSIAIENMMVMEKRDCQRLLSEHAAWWRSFWEKSSVELSDEILELHWYSGLYAMACCARNKKFPPGLWGYSTSDGMGWFGDYHLNYNYQGPFYALASANHTELLECYSSPLNDFLPKARRYAKEYLGISGAFYPVSLGPLGLETDYRPDTKEHGHLFLGQKSNGAYAAVIPMMHWYSTRDTEFAGREYYEFLFSVAEFWENYLVFEDGEYHIYNDSLHEVHWYKASCMPKNHLEKDCILSVGFVRMLMKLMIDLSEALKVNLDKIPKWRHILEHLHPVETIESEGKVLLRRSEGYEDTHVLALRYFYPAGEIGKYSTPELFEVAKTMHKHFDSWVHENMFCEYYPMAARLEYPPEEIISHIYDTIHDRAFANGIFKFKGGGMENSAAIPTTVNEMLLQSYEGIIRLFPVWDRTKNARFKTLRAYGAFLISASLEDGTVYAEILSEKGMPLTVEAPDEGYVIVRGNGERIPMVEKLTTVETQKGETVTVMRKIASC